MNTYQQLKDDLIKIGIKKGMVLLMHSSFKSLGVKDLTPKDVIEAVKEVITEEGTLLIPTLSYKTCSKNNPFFSYHDTPSCVGVISETFRKSDDTIRSLNPIHSVSGWGKYKDEILLRHEKDTLTLGYNSPFYLMLKYQPKILMLGCGLKPNTFMHLVENLNKVDYRQTEYNVDFEIIDKSGNKRIQKVELPDMSNYIQRYDRVESILAGDDLIQANILNAKSYLIDANKLLEKATEILKDNPHYFVDLMN
jgi:aminoglycoside 3-N-acetyltransferase